MYVFRVPGISTFKYFQKTRNDCLYRIVPQKDPIFLVYLNYYYVNINIRIQTSFDNIWSESGDMSPDPPPLNRLYIWYICGTDDKICCIETIDSGFSTLFWIGNSTCPRHPYLWSFVSPLQYKRYNLRYNLVGTNGHSGFFENIYFCLFWRHVPQYMPRTNGIMT